jgi:YidC/Oxa1 family membrane protein insertase
MCPLELTSNNTLSYSMYFGPTDYELLKDYNLNLENSVPIGWGIFGWLNRFVFFPLFSFLTNYFFIWYSNYNNDNNCKNCYFTSYL